MDALAGAVTSGSYLRGDGTDVIMDTLKAADMTGAIAIANGGTGQTTAAAAFNALNPMTTTGDIIYEASPTVATRLGIGSNGQVLTVASGIPSWATISTTPTTAQVLTAYAGLSAGGVGTYAYCTQAANTGNMTFGSTIAGGNIRPLGWNTGFGNLTGAPLSGTWMALAPSQTSTFNDQHYLLFVRIS
jgi:hypothetical protein